jgi:hypothetical protein
MGAIALVRCATGVAAWGLACSALAQVRVSEVEHYYSDAAVFTAVEPSPHVYPTRFPSLAAGGVRIALASGADHGVGGIYVAASRCARDPVFDHGVD